MPDESGVGQLPTALDPQRIATLQSLFPQQPLAAPGSTAQAAPGAGGMQDYANLAKQQTEQLLSSGPAQEAATARAAGPALAQQAREMPIPKTGWLDTQGQQQPGGFLHGLGRALMAIAGATVPGRAIQEAQYGPGIRRYNQEQSGIAEKIKATQSQAEGAEKEVGSLAQVAGRTIYGGAQVQKAEIGEQGVQLRVQQLAQQAQMKHQDALARIAAMTDINAKTNAARLEAQKMKDETQLAVTQMKDASQEERTSMLTGSLQSIANMKGAEDPSIKAALWNVFGLGTPQAPGGAQPEFRAPSAAPQKPAAKPGATKASAAPARPANVPSDYVYRKGSKGEGWYKPGAK